MPQILEIILYILLFIVCLSALIMIHEAGHLAAAKIFKVYCMEYSIGFGPKLIQTKGIKTETKFSLRAIPFGGYVSMVADENEVPEGLEVPHERTMNGTKKWKQAIILVAGVTMNAVLALGIFFVANIACTQKQAFINVVSISEEAKPLYDGKLETGNTIYLADWSKEEDTEKLYTNYYFIDKEGFIYFNPDDGGVTKDPQKVAVAFKKDQELKSLNDLNWTLYISYLPYLENGTLDVENPAIPNKNYEKIVFNVTKQERKDDSEEIIYTPVSTTVKCGVNPSSGLYEFSDIGLSMYLYKHRDNFGQAFIHTFTDFGDSATAIVRGFISLFTDKQAIQSMTGIIGIGFMSTRLLKNFGLYQFLQLWGLISVNLAIVNLFPFPGLDGWQLVVLIVEGITKKKMPDKAKAIVSYVGIGLLFLLMAAIVVKDIFTFII